MKHYKVRRILSESGSDLHVLTDSVGCPIYLPNLFATINFRQGQRSLATAYRSLASIGMAMDWIMARTGDELHDRVFGGACLTPEEALSLGHFLKMSQKRRINELAIEYDGRNQRQQRSKVRRLEVVRPRYDSYSGIDFGYVDARSASLTIVHVCRYLDWLYGYFLRSIHAVNCGADFRTIAKDGLTQLRLQRPRVGDSDSEDEKLWSIPMQTVELIELVLRPDGDCNPWKGPFIRNRNFLIWRLFCETGGRRGEVLNVKIDDFDLSVPVVTFRVSKSIPRTVPFTAPTGVLVEEFIRSHWCRIPKSNRGHGHLFTTTDGDRLSIRTLNRIFEVIRGIDPMVPDWLTPHTMRRTWNENFSRSVDALPEEDRWSDEKEAMVRNRLMGWVDSSRMAGVYLRRHTRENAQLIVDRIFSGTETIDGPDEGGGDAK